MKRCRRCGNEKPLDSFYKDKKSPDGYTWYCGECQKLLARAWFVKNRDKALLKAKEWAEKNPERRKKNRARYYAENKEKERANMIRWGKENRLDRNLYRKKRKVFERYGITFERYEEMLKEHNGVCAICRNGNSSGIRLHIDHDHITGIVRGLLCQRCNMGIGCFKDQVELFENAIKYLNRRMP